MTAAMRRAEETINTLYGGWRKEVADEIEGFRTTARVEFDTILKDPALAADRVQKIESVSASTTAHSAGYVQGQESGVDKYTKSLVNPRSFKIPDFVGKARICVDFQAVV